MGHAAVSVLTAMCLVLVQYKTTSNVFACETHPSHEHDVQAGNRSQQACDYVNRYNKKLTSQQRTHLVPKPSQAMI